jgi:CHAT domain-containing protein
VLVTDSASVDKYNATKAQDPRGRLGLNLYDGTAWLGRTTDISLTVSATAFLQSRAIKPSRGTRSFLAFGDPVTKGDDKRRYALLVDPTERATVPACERLREEWARKGPGALAGIADTIHAVGRDFDASANDLVLGQSFSDASVLSRSDLADYRVVFFGTHAVLPANHPCLPEAVLVTSLGPGKSDGFLDEGEILGLKMDADMVVLAACDTGGEGADQVDRTGLSGSGDELSGLARDFIYAGARNIVVSQWPVEAAATSSLMSRLFLSAASGQSDGLRQAELGLMNDKSTAHPYFWAGFSIVGDGARAMPASTARTAKN